MLKILNAYIGVRKFSKKLDKIRKYWSHTKKAFTIWLHLLKIIQVAVKNCWWPQVALLNRFGRCILSTKLKMWFQYWSNIEWVLFTNKIFLMKKTYQTLVNYKLKVLKGQTNWENYQTSLFVLKLPVNIKVIIFIQLRRCILKETTIWFL